MRVALIETERGEASVQHLIDKGLVTVYPCSTFKEVEQTYWSIKRGDIKCDMVVIDTITTLATTTRQDVTLAESADLWADRERVASQMRDWGKMSDLINRLMRLYRNLPQHSIFICHEGEREDLQSESKKKGPDLNPAIYKDIIAFSDVIARVNLAGIEFPKDPKNPDGEKWPIGTRVLRLKPSDEATAGARVPEGVNLPAIIPDPTLGKIVEAFGGRLPRAITLYGVPKVGKTRLSCSVDTLPKAANKAA